MANNKYNPYTSGSRQYFTSASSNAAIKVDPNGIQKLGSGVSSLTEECRQLYSKVIEVTNNLDSEVLGRYSISSSLIALQSNISKTIAAFESNKNGLMTCNNELVNADQSLANSMRGVQSLANMLVTPAGIFAPFNIGGQIVMANIALLNGLFGLNTTTSTQGTNLGFFDSIKQFGVDMFNKAKNTVTGVVDFVTTNKDRIIGTALDVGSIIVTGAAIAAAWVGTGLITAGTAGAGSVSIPGAVAVSVYGANNISNKITNIIYRWDNNQSNDADIGNVNWMKQGLSYAGGAVGEAIGGEEGKSVGKFIGGTVVYGAGEIYSAKLSSDALGTIIKGSSAMQKATEVTSKYVKPELIKNVVSGGKDFALSAAGMGDNKGEMVADTVKMLNGGDESYNYDAMAHGVDLVFSGADILKGSGPIMTYDNLGNAIGNAGTYADVTSDIMNYRIE